MDSQAFTPFATVLVGLIAGVLASVFISVVSEFFRDFVKHRLSVGDDEIVLGRNTEETMTQIVDHISSVTRRPKVFIAAARADFKFARRLAYDLRSVGVEVLLPEDMLAPGARISTELLRGVRQSQWVIYISSEFASHSKLSEEMLRLALESESLRGRPFVIPIKFGKTHIPEELSDRQSLDFRHDYEEPLSRLLQALLPSGEIADPEGSAVVPHSQVPG